jgi:putative endonuclease
LSREYRFFVYIMSSKSRVIYTGMTNDLVERVLEHKSLKVKGFTKKYKITRLVYFESLKYADNCIDREKQVKDWTRAKRVALIESMNPTWEDADWFDSDLNPKIEVLVEQGLTTRDYRPVRTADPSLRSG